MRKTTAAVIKGAAPEDDPVAPAPPMVHKNEFNVGNETLHATAVSTCQRLNTECKIISDDTFSLCCFIFYAYIDWINET